MLARPSASSLGPKRTAYDRRQRRSAFIHTRHAPRHPAPAKRHISPSPGHRVVITMSFLREALKGAKADVESAGDGLMPRLARGMRVAGILGMEVAAIAALAPYGVYSMAVYRRLTSLPAQILPCPANANTTGNAIAPAPAPTPAPTPAPANVTESAQHRSEEQPPLHMGSQATDLATILSQLPQGRYGVAVHRQVSYDPAPRNTLDVYVPLPFFRPPQHQSQSQSQSQLLPVVFFVHGGVWASGETWQYAPMATRLAQAGLVVVVPTYTLYPEALAGTMVEEVSTALSWTFDNVGRYGGDPARITAAGHSAGGHLAAWALLRRAAAAEAVAMPVMEATATRSPAPASLYNENGDGDRFGGGGGAPDLERRCAAPSHEHRVQHEGDEQPQGSAAHRGDPLDTAAYLLGGGGASLPGVIHAMRNVVDVQLHPQPGIDMSYDDDSAAAAAGAAAAAPGHVEADVRMPALFVGMSAVYDIAKHYEFEKSRAVHELSMMKRVMGGPAGFAAASPSVILAAAANAVTASPPPQPSPSYGQIFPNAASEDRHFTSYFTSFELLGDAIPTRAGLNETEDGAATVAKAAGRGPAFSLAAAARLPPFVVMGSCSDHMVPWHEGAELVLQLRRCGMPVRHLLYNHVGHGDFVMAWRPLKPSSMPMTTMMGDGPDTNLHLEGLLPCARDLLRLATGRVQPVPATSTATATATAATATAASYGDAVSFGAEQTLLARSRL